MTNQAEQVSDQALNLCVKLAGRFASNDVTRLSLTYVQVTPRHVMATDGHCAFVIRRDTVHEECGLYTPDAEPLIEDLRCRKEAIAEQLHPQILQVVPDESTKSNVTIHSDFIDNLRNIVEGLKSSSEVALSFTRDHHVDVVLTRSRGSGKKAVDVKSRLTLDLGPEHSYCFKPLHKFGVNGRYLLDALHAVNGSYFPVTEIDLRMDDSMGPIRIKGLFGVAVVMPMRL